MAALDEQTLKFFHFKLGKNREDIDCLSRARAVLQIGEEDGRLFRLLLFL